MVIVESYNKSRWRVREDSRWFKGFIDMEKWFLFFFPFWNTSSFLGPCFFKYFFCSWNDWQLSGVEEKHQLTSELAVPSELMGKESFLTRRFWICEKDRKKKGTFHRTMNQGNVFSELLYKWKSTEFGLLVLLMIGNWVTLGSILDQEKEKGFFTVCFRFEIGRVAIQRCLLIRLDKRATNLDSLLMHLNLREQNLNLSSLM